MKYVIGNLINKAEQGDFDVIVQGCNCFNTQSAGLAAEIRSKYPNAYAIDCRTVKGDRNKLGNYTSANFTKNSHSFVIVNAYTQYTCWDVNDMLSYPAIEEVFRKISQDFEGKRIGIPLIGAGLAQGDWGKIVRLIEKSNIENITAVVFDKRTLNSVVLPTFNNNLDTFTE
jgi:O-acetyl-ADP-ribose deacetylase (regulator of RNase III)